MLCYHGQYLFFNQNRFSFNEQYCSSCCDTMSENENLVLSSTTHCYSLYASEPGPAASPTAVSLLSTFCLFILWSSTSCLSLSFLLNSTLLFSAAAVMSLLVSASVYWLLSPSPVHKVTSRLSLTALPVSCCIHELLSAAFSLCRHDEHLCPTSPHEALHAARTYM